MSKTKTLFIPIALVTLISIVIPVMLFFFIYNKKNSIDEITIKIKEEQGKTLQVQKMLSVLSQTKQFRETVSQYLLSDNTIVDFIETVESIGKETGVVVTISGLVADDSTNAPVGTINKVKARIDGKGKWVDILKFATLIESMPYKVSLSNISLRQDGMTEKSKTPSWNISFQIEILKIK